ncbi:MAG: amino acid-binding protein [Desulfobacterales bacterium]|jgi:hypothetical protein|nr:amino acid-binding protein [Desulfobacterales bacterium]
MKVEQLSVFIENKSGRLAEVTNVLAKGGLNIRALSLADTADFGVLRLIVNDSARAKAVLTAAGFTATVTEVLALAVPDRPGGLAGILGNLAAKGINVEYLYAFVSKSGENAFIICRFENINAARNVLQQDGVQILNESDIQAL